MRPTARPASSPFQLLKQRAGQVPDDIPFQVLDGPALTYREWARYTSAMREFLLAVMGVRPEDRILLIFDRGSWLEYAVAYLAVIAAGATAVSVHADDGYGVTAITQGSMQAAISVAAGDRSVQAARRLGRYVEVDFAKLAFPKATLESIPERPAASLAEILLTSGTTGPRKAVGCTYADLTSGLRQSAKVPSDAFSDQSPFVHHIMPGTQASQRVVLQALRNNRLISINVESLSPRTLLSAVETSDAKFVGLVPWTADRLIETCLREQRYLPSVHWVSVGSAHVPTRLLHGLARVFPAAQIMNMYGLTEAGWARIHGTYPDRVTSIGTPEPGTKAEIRDADGTPMPAGRLGELWISHIDSPSRFYVGDPARQGFVKVGVTARD